MILCEKIDQKYNIKFETSFSNKAGFKIFQIEINNF